MVLARLDFGGRPHRNPDGGHVGSPHLSTSSYRSRQVHPERTLRAFNRPSREAAQTMAFAWLDTREVRTPESRAYAILNDSEQPVSQSVLDAMRAYEVHPFRGRPAMGRALILAPSLLGGAPG